MGGAGRRLGLTREQWAGSQKAEVKTSPAVATTGRWNQPRAAYPPRTAGCPSEQCCPETMGRAGQESGLHKTPPRGPRLPDIGANSECALGMHSLSHALIRSSACTMGTLHSAPWKGRKFLAEVPEVQVPSGRIAMPRKTLQSSGWPSGSLSCVFTQVDSLGGWVSVSHHLPWKHL